MPCISPIMVNNGRSVVSCGQCMPCRIKRQEEWTTRIIHEAKQFKDNCFITLTYAPEHYTGTVIKSDVQLFLKRLRKFVEPKKIRYISSGEYGDETNRAHYHFIIFGLPPTESTRTIIQACWRFGYVDEVLPFAIYRARYMAKYVVKKLTGQFGKEYYERECKEPEFMLMSKNPGIGYASAEQYISQWKKLGFCITSGKKRSIPQYYKNRFLTESERSALKERTPKQLSDVLETVMNAKTLKEKDLTRKQIQKNIVASMRQKKGVL